MGRRSVVLVVKSETHSLHYQFLAKVSILCPLERHKTKGSLGSSESITWEQWPEMGQYSSVIANFEYVNICVRCVRVCSFYVFPLLFPSR